MTVKYHDTDGLIENTFTGDNMDYDGNTKVTGRLIWKATDRTDVDLRASVLRPGRGLRSWFS